MSVARRRQDVSAHPAFFDIITDDENYPDRWLLGDPVSADGRPVYASTFTGAERYFGPAPWKLSIKHPGRPVAFHLGSFDMPVVTDEVAKVVQKIAPADVEFFPVTVGSLRVTYQILNVLRSEDCVDEDRADVIKWLPEDGRPDKIGSYRQVHPVFIKPGRYGDIFRVKGWEIALIVSERMRAALETIDGLGIVFDPVT
jgi:hypothetical protein